MSEVIKGEARHAVLDVDTGIGYYQYSLTPELFSRIKELQAAVTQLHVFSITEFRFDVEWYSDEQHKHDERVDIPELVVMSDSYKFTACAKHCTDAGIVSTETQYINEMTLKETP